MVSSFNYFKMHAWSTYLYKHAYLNSHVGETGANDTQGKMIHHDFSNGDVIYDVSYSN